MWNLLGHQVCKFLIFPPKQLFFSFFSVCFLSLFARENARDVSILSKFSTCLKKINKIPAVFSAAKSRLRAF